MHEICPNAVTAVIAWRWFCPKCGDEGVVYGERPRFSRCFRCDSAVSSGDPPPPPLQISRTDRQAERKIILAEVIEMIESEMAKTSPETGHGKAQRAFGNKLLDHLKTSKDRA